MAVFMVSQPGHLNGWCFIGSSFLIRQIVVSFEKGRFPKHCQTIC